MVKLVIAVLAVGLMLPGCTGQPRAGQPTAADGATTSAALPPTGQSPSGAAPSQPTQPVQSPAPAPTGPPASDRCTAAVLTGAVRLGDSAAGNRYATLTVTNTGPVPCTLYGYGGLQLAAPDGTALPTSTGRDEPPGPSLVRLASGATAAKRLHWGVVPTGGEPVDRPCQPEPRTLRIIPPDETQPFTVDWRFGPVCAAGTFHDSAFYQA